MTANTAQRVAVQRPDNWSRNEIALGACPDGPFTTLAQHDAIVSALLLQVAEQAAEIDQARRTAEYWKGEHIAGNEELYRLRTQGGEVNRALHAEAREYLARAESAERAREEACGLLGIVVSEVDNYRDSVSMATYNRIAAFLAANGGGNG